MDKVYINKIKWLDQDGLEAEVQFSINEHLFWAYCHPCNFLCDTIYTVMIDCLEEDISENSFWNLNINSEIKIVPDLRDSLRYYCYGKVSGINPLTIDLNHFKLSIGDWINDPKVIGEYVYFVISRLDIINADN